jgi:hypothetical protein
MSLINDALKKAQKQRTGETPSLASMPSVGGETPHRIARRDKPASFDTLVIRAGIGLGALLVIVVGGYFAFRSESAEQRTASSPQPVAAVPAPAPASPAVQQPAPATPLPAQNTQVSAATPTPAPAPTPTFTLPVAQVAAPASNLPPPASPSPAPASTPAVNPQVSGFRSQVSAPSPAPAQPTGSDPRVSPFSPVGKPRDESPVALAKGGASQVSEPAKPALKLEPRAIQYIENIKVAGIMARPTDSKVLMNDRVYRLGSLVEAEMGLTLVGITANSLTFEDGNGGRYTRTF